MAPRIKNKSTIQTTEIQEVVLAASPQTQMQFTANSTSEETVRKKAGKPTVLDKGSTGEKESCPQIIIQYTDSNGVKKSKTYGCASLRLHEFKDSTLGKSGIKTGLEITIEATVLEVS